MISHNHRLDLPNIYLVGPMGAGKTTVGRYLAELLNRQFIDSDHEIESRTGANIPWILKKKGNGVSYSGKSGYS